MRARARITLGAVVFVSALAAAFPAVASAHAYLVRTFPAASRVLDSPPATVALTFDEAVEPRFAITRDLMREAVHDILEVRAEGTGRLAQLLDLMYMGDWVSCYLALDNDVDPGPIDAIFQLKDRLAEQ